MAQSKEVTKCMLYKYMPYLQKDLIDIIYEFVMFDKSFDVISLNEGHCYCPHFMPTLQQGTIYAFHVHLKRDIFVKSAYSHLNGNLQEERTDLIQFFESNEKTMLVRYESDFWCVCQHSSSQSVHIFLFNGSLQHPHIFEYKSLATTEKNVRIYWYVHEKHLSVPFLITDASFIDTDSPMINALWSQICANNKQKMSPKKYAL